MKLKLLAVLTILLAGFNTNAQNETTDYVSGLVDPIRMINKGAELYVQGFNNLYKIDTADSNPTASSIYSPPTDFWIGNITIGGNTLYMVQENYIESTDTYLGSRIVSLDLNNLATAAEEIFTTNEYISSLIIDGDIIYFSAETLTNPPNFDPFITHVDKIDISQPNPQATNIIANLTDGVAADMILHNGNLLISVRDDATIYLIDTTQNTPIAEDLNINLNFPKGVFKSGYDLYITDGNLARKLNLDNTDDALETIAQNTTYQDDNNGTPYNANFKDIALIGSTMYMTLESQGKIVKAIDHTLSLNELNSNLQDLTVINNSNNLEIKGLTNSLNTKLYNLLGQELATKNISQSDNSIDISTLANGVYLLNIDNKKTIKFTK